jgi:ornithine carbamoyltransferase
MKGKNARFFASSEPEMVQARQWQQTSQRAPERRPEESRSLQIGAAGWLPGTEQPRGARRKPRKKGGTAEVDAFRPFGQQHQVVDPSRHRTSGSERGTTMQNPVSTIPDDIPESNGGGLLRAMTPPEFPEQDRPMLSLGGGATPKPRTFSISAGLRGRSLVDDIDLSPEEIAEVLDTASRLKRMAKRGEPHTYLTGRTLGMLFQHPSTRTRVSFESGMAQLGGVAIFLGVNDLQLRRGETVEDTARVLGRYVDAIVARVVQHSDVVALAQHSAVPVINGLSDRCHPTQALADLLTLQEQFGKLKGLKLAYLGDGNNVAASLIVAGAAAGVSVTVACPPEYAPPADIVTEATWLAAASDATVKITSDPWEAVAVADAVYTDVHVSMGQPDSAARAVALAPYKVTPEIMAAAASHAVFLHCLPMHRDEEVSGIVADGPQSVVFDEAENRLHVHKALLLHMLC